MPNPDVAKPAKETAHFAGDMIMIDPATSGAEFKRLLAYRALAALRRAKILEIISGETVFLESQLAHVLTAIFLNCRFLRLLACNAIATLSTINRYPVTASCVDREGG